MSALHYMETQLKKHRRNYERESARGVPAEMLESIARKISSYETAVEALSTTDRISRSGALKILRESAVKKYPTSFYLGILAAAQEIENMPAADVVEAKKDG